MQTQIRSFRTVRTLEAIKPPKVGRVEHWDKKVKGLGLRVSSSGRKTWVLMYRTRGDKRLRRATLGTYPTLSLADTRDMARADLRSAAMGRDPSAERKAEREADTFGELAEAYMERYAKKRKKSWFKDQQALDRDLLPRFRHRKAANIKRREVIEMLEEIADRGAPVGSNRTLEIIRRIYNWGIEREIVILNPCSMIKKIGVERRRERVLTDDEIRAVWSAFEKETPRMCALFKLRLLTIQRPGEVSRMRWEDIDSDWWTIPPEFTKNGLSHRVPLTNLALELLEPHRGSGRWVFPSRKGDSPIRVGALSDSLRRNHHLGLEPFTAHDLRRTAATAMASLGIDRLTLSKILNHVETGVTAVYDRATYDKQKRRALERWARKLRSIIGEPAGATVVSIG